MGEGVRGDKHVQFPTNLGDVSSLDPVQLP